MSKVCELGEGYWLGDFYENNGWKRTTLFHISRNSFGGSTSWPVTEIDLIEHPSRDGCNAHKEIKISIRNEIRRSGGAIDVDGNKAQLRHPDDILEKDIINQSVAKLKELGFVSLPLSVYVCMRHVEDFWVEGDFWSENGL
jgi:hypothetical protein